MNQVAGLGLRLGRNYRRAEVSRIADVAIIECRHFASSFVRKIRHCSAVCHTECSHLYAHERDVLGFTVRRRAQGRPDWQVLSLWGIIRCK